MDKMDKMDKMAVDTWRPKLATELPAHVSTILDKVDQQVRAKPSVTKELSNVASRHRAGHELQRTTFAMTLPLASALMAHTQKEVWVCFHKLGRSGYNAVGYFAKRMCAL